MSDGKRHYIPPKHQQYVTVVDQERRYIEVSDDFCKLVGYDRDELLAKKYDDLTAANTNSIEAVYGLFEKLGYMHGLWMLVSREGTRILVRYESWIRSDDLIELGISTLPSHPKSYFPPARTWAKFFRNLPYKKMLPQRA